MGDCGCVYVEVDEFVTVISEGIRKARKPYKCGECGREITKGEQYEYIFATFEGRKENYRTCMDCLSVRKTFFCDGWYYGGIWELLSEHLQELHGTVPVDCLANITPNARAKVCELIEEYWEDLDDQEDEGE